MLDSVPFEAIARELLPPLKASKMSLQPRDLRRSLFVLAVFAGFAASAGAQVVDIAWDASGNFETKSPLAGGKFVEVCGKLTKGQAVIWRFEADRPLAFNIHYHAGDQVVFPENRAAVSALSGTLEVAVDQDYCWMWTNPAKAEVLVTLRLRLR